MGGASETPTSKRKSKSRWDETPSSQRQGVGSTPQVGGATPMMGATPNFTGKTPAGAMAMGLQTPSAGK